MDSTQGLFAVVVKGDDSNPNCKETKTGPEKIDFIRSTKEFTATVELDPNCRGRRNIDFYTR